MSNGNEVCWLMDLDQSTLIGLDDNTVWDWEATSKDMRKRVKALERQLDRTGLPVFAPCVKARVWHWPTWDDWQHERNARLIWIDLGPMVGWDVMPVVIWLAGKRFLCFPWMMLFLLCVSPNPATTLFVVQRVRRPAPLVSAKPAGVASGRGPVSAVPHPQGKP